MIGWGWLVKQLNTRIRGTISPLFFKWARRPSTPPTNYPMLHHHLTYLQTLSAMNTSPTGNGRPNLRGPSQYRLSNIHTDHRIANNIHGNSNTNIGNVSNSYNNITNLRIDEESLRIQAWLSPLDPNKRHQDVRNRRFDGVGEWVPQRNESKSWCESKDGSVNRTLLCCGGPGVGKTYIRYKSFPQRWWTVLINNKLVR